MKEIDGMKVCSSCKVELYVDDFYSDARAADHLHSECKSCHRETQKRYLKTEKGRLTIGRKVAKTYKAGKLPKWMYS